MIKNTAVFGEAPKLVAESLTLHTGTTSAIDLDVSGLDIREDDFVIVHWACNVNGSYTPAGYTNIIDLHQNATHGSALEISYKQQSDTPDTTISIPGGTGNPSWPAVGLVQVWRHVSEITGAVGVEVNLDMKANPPSVSTARGDTVVFSGSGGYSGSDSVFSSTDADLTTDSATDGKEAVIGVGHVRRWDDAAFDPAQFTTTLGTSSGSSNYASCACTFILKEL